MSSLHINLFQPTFLCYLSVITLLGAILHGNRTFQTDLQEVREIMPKVADFIEEDFAKRINTLEGRIKELEKSVCRCELGPKKGVEKEMDRKGKTEDEYKKNGTSKKDNKRKEGKESELEETTREETVGEEMIRCVELEL
ncbi:hypothetical protein EV426DRAFT_702028 [Tirmania nivea]|nr:hypothetical protein EV426DRAFT_702028 [Tirmania nivea]